jgi:DNA polymerase III epsilon subunit-like protein
MSKTPKSFIAFDLETTGFAPPCKIIEIGAVKVINGKVVE